MSARGVITLDASGSGGLSFETFVRGGFLTGVPGGLGFPVFDNGAGFSGTEVFYSYGTSSASKYILARGSIEYYFSTHTVWGNIDTIEYGTRGTGSFNGSGHFTGGNVQLKITNLAFFNARPANATQEAQIELTGEVHNFSGAHMDTGSGFSADRLNRYADQLDNFAQEFVGSAGNDVYIGTAYDDIIRGGGGNDVFDGGGGNDIIFFTGTRASYTITPSGGDFLISPTGGAWTTTVTDVEFVRFADAYVDLSDLSATGVGTDPYDLELDNDSIPEDAAVGTTVAVISSSDDDAGDSVSYTLWRDESGLFEIVGNEIRVRKALDYETATSHDITIRMIDGQGNIVLETVTIDVEDVRDTNAAPHSLKLSSTRVTEGVPVGTVVGTFSATDPDGDPITYSLLDTAGGLFKISGNKLVTARAIDYDQVQKAVVTVKASDGQASVTASFTLSITDLLKTINGTSKSEVLKGGLGADRIYAKAGNDTLYGYGGDDLLYGEAGNDVLVGGPGADKLYGGSGTDTASYAGASRGVVANLSKASTNTNDAKGDVYSSIENLKGTSHADTLTGNSGQNRIDGGAGNDHIYGGAGNDTLNGNAGNDRLYGGTGNDTLSGSSGSDRLYGDSGHDRLYGDSGNDSLYGGAGNDRLYGGTGDDTLKGGSGNDRLYGDSGNDFLYGDAGADLLYGGAGGDRMYGGAGNDQLFGGAGQDRLYGDAGSDDLYGGAGNDRLYGGANNDRLHGDAGNDTLYGGSGHDKLTGGLGADILYGGPGKDTFIFTSVKDSTAGPAGRDTIADFDGAAGDRIDLRAIDANTRVGGNQAFDFIGTDSFSGTAGELRYEKRGAGTLVQGDVDGDGKADFSIQLGKGVSLSEGYFLL